MPKGIKGFQKGHKPKVGFKKGNIPWSKLHPELMPRNKREKNGNWKGGETITNGYILLYQPSHPFAYKTGYIKRARLVMEQITGRYLTPKEVVHHKGVHFPIKSIENKQDDSPENLQLFCTTNEHTSFHHSIKK